MSTEVILAGVQFLDLEIATNTIGIADMGYEGENMYYYKKGLAIDALDAARDKIIKTALPVAWGAVAFGFLVFGIRREVKSLRIIALALLGITIIKLFVYDISNVSETGKIIAFILLGVLILIISFIYQKIKKLVIEDDNTATKEDTTV